MLEIKNEAEFSELLVTHKEQLLLLIAIQKETGLTQKELIKEYLSQTLPTLPRNHETYYVRLNHRSQRKKQLQNLMENHLVMA